MCKCLHLEQVKDVSSVQAVITEPVQQLHLCPGGLLLEGPLAQGVGFALLQLPAVVDDVVQVTTERLGAGGQKDGTGEKEREREISPICLPTPY